MALTRKMELNNRTVSKLLFYQVIYILICRFCVDVLHFPSVISYGIDIINALVTMFFLYSKVAKKKLFLAGMAPVFFSVILLIGFCLADGIINMVKTQLILWAFRNTMRYYPFFFSIIALWDEKMLDRTIKLLIRLQYPNFLVVLFQYLILGLKQDNIGGIFGNTTGCNAALNIYLCIITALLIEKYIHREITLIKLLCNFIIFLTTAVIAELKVGFIELPMMIILAILLNKPSFKTIIATIAVILMIPIGIQSIISLFPRWAYSFENMSSFLGTATEIGGGYNISRLGAFSDINNLFFHNDLSKKILGLGFGNCEYSSINFFTSTFYERYGWLHYRWFTHQTWFLECGYLGVILYFLFFVALFFWFVKQKRTYGDINGFGSFGQIIIALCFLNFIYNSSLRAEEGYILFLALALPCLRYSCLSVKTE